MIEYPCPHCGERLRVAPGRAGGTFVCGMCGGETTVPGEVPPEPELSLAAQIAVATKRWSGRLVVLLAVAALIGRDLISQALHPPVPIGAVQAVGPRPLEAAHNELRAVAASAGADCDWRTISEESVGAQLIVGESYPADRIAGLVTEVLDRMTRVCPNVSFVLEIRDPSGQWLGGSMRRGVAPAPTTPE